MHSHRKISTSLCLMSTNWEYQLHSDVDQKFAFLKQTFFLVKQYDAQHMVTVAGSAQKDFML